MGVSLELTLKCIIVPCIANSVVNGINILKPFVDSMKSLCENGLIVSIVGIHHHFKVGI